MLRFLQAARQKVLDRHYSASDPVTRYYSGATYAVWRSLAPLIRQHSTGLVLDAGAGRGQWRSTIESTGAKREALDVVQRPNVDLDWVADVTDMPNVPTERFDAAMCNHVLEHVRDPYAAISELNRVLKPGGLLVISVPHLSRLHELPHDYFRYTPGGLRALLERFGFEVVELKSYGGLCSFLHHQASTAFLGLASALGPLYYLAVLLNAPFSVASVWLDFMVDRKPLIPEGVIAVARKKQPAIHCPTIPKSP